MQLSIKFRREEDHLKDQRDKLQRKKDYKDVVFLLRDFSDVKEIAKKINMEHIGVRCLSINEKLCLKYMTQKRYIGDGIEGLLTSQNVYGHSKVTKSSIELCKSLALNNDVFGYFHIKGRTNDIIEFAESTKPALKTVQNFLEPVFT